MSRQLMDSDEIALVNSTWLCSENIVEVSDDLKIYDVFYYLKYIIYNLSIIYNVLSHHKHIYLSSHKKYVYLYIHIYIHI